MITLTPDGLYCEAGDFYIDPWHPVPHAVITHAHSDHAGSGHGSCLVSRVGLEVTRRRTGAASLQGVEYGEVVMRNGVRVSLHPAGHVLGSAQVRVEHRGEVWVFSGDYKLQTDPTCAAFEPVRCHTFITESTFGLPIYRWEPPTLLFGQMNGWWQSNRSAGRASVVFAYALGKAQRILASVDAGIGPIYTHGAVEAVIECYRAARVVLPATRRVAAMPKGHDYVGALVVAPPSAQGTGWMRRFGDYADAFASGWMQIRGVRRRRAVDRGFALSDHADWPGLLQAVADSRAQRVFVTHGYSEPLARWLNEHALEAHAWPTRFAGEQGSAETDAPVGEPDEAPA